MTVVGQQVLSPEGRIGVQIANKQCLVQAERFWGGETARITDHTIRSTIDPLRAKAKKSRCQCD